MTKRNRSLIACLTLCVLAAALAWFGTRDVAVLRQGSLLLDDFWLTYFAKPRGQRSDIIVLAVNEETLAQYPFRSPINRRLIASLVQELAQRDVRAIGIDLIFDQPTNADDDRALLDALDGYSGPMVVAVGDASNGLTSRQLAFQNEFLAGRTVGLAGMLVTGGVVRHVYPGENGTDGFRPSFAAALASSVGARPPTDAQRLYYRMPDGDVPAIRSYPAHHLEILPPAWFDDAIVLIGADLPNQDVFRTPLSVAGKGDTMTGINIHAQALAQLLDDVTFPAVSGRTEALILALAVLLGIGLPFTQLSVFFKAALGLGALTLYWIGSVAYFANGGELLPLLMPTLAFLLAISFGSAYARRQDQVEKRLIREAFRRYVSPSIIDEMLADPDKLVLGGEKREMSFVFSDLEGFTTLTEKLTPEAAVTLLQEYLEGMLRIAFEFGGTVDRLVGDGIAVFFGAPAAQPDHAKRAVGCGLAWDRECEAFRKEQLAKGIALGITRIGVHTGSAVVGNVGSAERFHYTAHGDCVNTAARLEGANKHLGTRTCMSKEVAQHCPGEVFIPVGRLVLKGKANELECVTSGRDLSAQTVADYLAAYDLLDVDSAASEQRFATLCFKLPDEGLPALHLQRLRRGEVGTRIVLEGK